MNDGINPNAVTKGYAQYSFLNQLLSHTYSDTPKYNFRLKMNLQKWNQVNITQQRLFLFCFIPAFVRPATQNKMFLSYLLAAVSVSGYVWKSTTRLTQSGPVHT